MEDEIEHELGSFASWRADQGRHRFESSGCVCAYASFRSVSVHKVDTTSRFVAFSSSYAKSTKNHSVQSTDGHGFRPHFIL